MEKDKKATTNCKKLKQEVKDLEERLDALFERAPDAYYMFDIKGNLAAGNRAAEELSGYIKKELIGKNILKIGLISPDEFPKVTKQLAEGLAGKSTGPIVYNLTRKDGSKILVETRTTLVKIKGEKFILGIVRDITERKQAEQELRAKNKQLEKINKLTVDRELKMIELKNRIKELESQLIDAGIV